MKTYPVNTWSEVKEALLSVKKDWLDIAKNLGLSTSHPSFLYRGQGNSDWKLETTLERVVRKPVLLTEYYRHILKTRPQVEAFSNTRWDMIGLPEYTEWAKSRSDLNWPDFPGYEYMIYLRHHGFPSPLLDWTRSPYVAAYFAFTKPPNDGDNVAIYCYSETVGVGKSWSSSDPLITVRGPFARSHKRHFLQQCAYTVCSQFDGNGLRFAHHEEAFGLGKPDQDLVWKIVAPCSIAATALKELDSMNVNALSLMGSEDALIETLGVREYLLHDT